MHTILQQNDLYSYHQISQCYVMFYGEKAAYEGARIALVFI